MEEFTSIAVWANDSCVKQEFFMRSKLFAASSRREYPRPCLTHKLGSLEGMLTPRAFAASLSLHRLIRRWLRSS